MANTVYDTAGNLTNTTLNEAIVYDANNRQTSYTSGGTTTYSYDAQGNRVKKSGPSGTSVYVYDAFGKLAAEYSNVSPQPANVGTFYRTVDHLGSTRLVTDGLGAAVENTDYLPFGEEILVSSGDARHGIAAYGESGRVHHKFTGKERDTESGMDYFLARYYSGPMGRFLSVDPNNADATLSDPRSWNGYSYTRNSPVRFTDPNGKQSGTPVQSENEFEETVETHKGMGKAVVNSGVDLLNTALLETPPLSILKLIGVPAEIPRFEPSNETQATAMEVTEAALLAAEVAGAAVAGVKLLAGGASKLKTVGRHMSPDELKKMRETGLVQEGGGGQTRVGDPADPTTYKAAPKGDVYVEFDVPADRVLPHSKGTGRIPGPNSPDARVPGRNPDDFKMPSAENIRVP